MNKSIKISFLGDISLNGKYEKMYIKGVKPFKSISRILKDTVVIGNLECLARSSDGSHSERKPRLETSVDTLNLLKDLNLNIVSLANNHVFDNLDNGFIRTISFLQQKKIKTIGASLDQDFQKPILISKNNIKIAIFSYITKDTNPVEPGNTNIKLNYFHQKKTFKLIKEYKKKVDYIVVFIHWGGRVEDGYFPDWEQPKLARKLIDYGVDLIVGHHSHTLQPFEIYKKKYIFYSLGNFCFSDIFFENKLYSRLNKRKLQSAFLTVEFTKESYSPKLNYIKNINGHIFLSNKTSNISFTFRRILFLSIFKMKLFWGFYFICLKLFYPIYDFLFVQKGDILQALKSEKIIRHIKKLKEE